jgi:predicted chitinase
VQQGITTIGDHSKDGRPGTSRRRIGADNERVSDSFYAADMGNTPHSQATGDIASGNTDLTSTFNKAQMGNIVQVVPNIEHSPGRAPSHQTAHSTTIASNNQHLHDVFEGAVIGNTSAAHSSTFIASGNRNMARSFTGARMGNTVGSWAA